ncbi:MAG: cytochrome c maturation protein CcmE [Tatlockia sp.]|nr:cytochrome c maturation protein CcmE [Tatlockia sp.]
MNSVRQRKVLFIIFYALIISLVSALVLYALKQNINLFYTPTEIAEGKVGTEKIIRLGGMVVKGSIIRAKDDLGIQFQITDYNRSIIVNYRGILPDLFREEQGIVTLGKLSINHEFNAQEVLAKHDANYMPPEVKDALAKQVRLKETKL